MISINIFGIIAGIGTTFSFAPQVYHVFHSNKTDGLSPYMILIHFTGLSFWVIYGFFKKDFIIIFFNLITIFFVFLITCKLLKNKYVKKIQNIETIEMT